MCGSCDKHGREMKCIQHFGEKHEGKVPLVKFSFRTAVVSKPVACLFCFMGIGYPIFFSSRPKYPGVGERVILK